MGNDRVSRAAVLLLALCALVESRRSWFDWSTDSQVSVRSPQVLRKYLVVSPSVFRTGTSEVVSVTMFGLSQRTILVISIEWGEGKSWSKTTIFHPEDSGKPKDVILKVPENGKAGRSKLKVVGSGGLNFKHEKNIRIEKIGLEVFIQTDKPAYKPGDKVQFRVIVVTPNLKPSAGKLQDIAVVNPTGTRILQWKDKDLDEGFVSLNFILSKKPVLGNWKITAKFQGATKEVMIKVDKYVLPKFEVIIEEPSYLQYKKREFSARVCAKYTYGKKVEGKVTATFCYSFKRINRWMRLDRLPPCVVISKKIDGCADFDVTMNDKGSVYYYRNILSIRAAVTETATGTILNGTRNVTLVNRDTKIEFVGMTEFKPGFPFSGKIAIKNPDGTPAINKKITFKATCCSSRKLIDVTKTIANGLYEFTITPPVDAKRMQLQAFHISDAKGLSQWERRASAYHDAKSWYSPSKTYLVIQKPKNVLQVGTVNMINVRFNPNGMADSKIYYKLACRGNIENSGSIHSQSDNKKVASEKIILFVTQKMVPKCRLLVFFVRKDGEFVGDSTELSVEQKFENEVSVSFSESKVKPGSNITISLQAAPGSRFAISAVDKSVHLLGASNDLKAGSVMNVIERLDVTGAWNPTKCNGYGYQRPWFRREKRSIYWPGRQSNHVDGNKAFNDAGLIYFSNLKIDVKPCKVYRYSTTSRVDADFDSEAAPGRPMFSVKSSSRKNTNLIPRKKVKVTKKPNKEEKKKVIVRSDFPETWIWTEGKIDMQTGKKTIEAKVPDTLTTWYANAFAMSSQNGIGVSAMAPLLVFQPFFVSLTLPYSIVRGESVKIPVTVFNYLEKCLTIRLTIEASKDFEADRYSSKDCVCGGKSTTLNFKITPKKIGKIPITVKAISTKENVCAGNKEMASSVGAADGVKRMLLVEPEGVKKEYNYNSLICLRPGKSSEYSETFQLTLPSRVVPDSLFAKISLYGDLMGPSLTDLDKLLAMPFGCGEQNMLKFAPNIYILQYLTKTNQLTSKIEDRAKKFMVSGYQRELTYKRSDGSYSAFGNRDKQGSTWLTAFVLKSYAQAKPYIFIDDKEISHSMKWLLSLQKSDGCFKEIGMVHHKEMKGGVSSEISMTAFVFSALIEAGLDVQSPKAQLALKCIGRGLPSLSDTYSTALIAYTLTVAESSNRAMIMDKLNGMAIKQDGSTHWESDKSSGHGSAPVDIEMTSYALLAYVSGSQKNTIAAAPVVRWLTKQRNSLGGFASTQDTCVALQALALYGGQVYKAGTNLNVNIVASKLNHNFAINDDNKLVLQQVEIPEVPTQVDISANGTGCALLQANVKYNLPVVNEKPKFFMTLSPSQVGPKCRHSIKICASYSAKGASNMALIEVKMVSGFEPIKEHLDQIMQSTSNDLLKDYEVDGNMLSLYFEKIESKTCLSVLVEQTTVVTDRKKSHAVIYDYYNTGERASTSYGIDNCNQWN